MDLTNDVLYIRVDPRRGEPAFGEETPERFSILRTDDDQFAGLTVVNYWRRFGKGDIRDATLATLKTRIAECTRSHRLGITPPGSLSFSVCHLAIRQFDVVFVNVF